MTTILSIKPVDKISDIISSNIEATHFMVTPGVNPIILTGASEYCIQLEWEKITSFLNGKNDVAVPMFKFETSCSISDQNLYMNEKAILHQLANPIIKACNKIHSSMIKHGYNETFVFYEAIELQKKQSYEYFSNVYTLRSLIGTAGLKYDH